MIKLKKKTNNVIQFMDRMYDFIISHPQFRIKTTTKSEAQVQAELRPIIISYLEFYFRDQGLKDPIKKAHKSFYWEGQEGKYGEPKRPVFGARNYPDFIIDEPYKMAIEYKQSPNGSVIKQGIGQSIMHTASGDFDYVFYMFHDQSDSGAIRASINSPQGIEVAMIKRMWEEFNVRIRLFQKNDIK